MKKLYRILIVAASVFLLSLLAVSLVSAAPNPFVGSWESTDIDGSYQVLTVGGGPGASHRVRYYDYGASVCDDPPFSGALEFAASASGFLAESGNDLTGTLPVYCLTRPPAFWGNAAFHYVYDPSSDTLTDSFGVVWARR